MKLAFFLRPMRPMRRVPLWAHWRARAAVLSGLALSGLLCASPALAEFTSQLRALTPPVIAPQGDVQYLHELQQRAAALHLAEDAQWLALLHYERQPVTRQLRSLADDIDFFNAPNGKWSASDELQATLAAGFDPISLRSGRQVARCRFPARWAWLGERLAIDTSRLPAVQCAAYDAWLGDVQARSVSLVFPAAYVNSPASMYGHTFLRLNGAGEAEGQPLLAYTLSYAADSNMENDGLMFAIKGLFGLYPGSMSSTPYYLRIRDYTHLENRDIWEYDLSLTRPEIDRLLAHAWELGYTQFDYYFFDENCSYLLLTLLDIARPGLGLSEQFRWWTIPVDTVRAVAESPGLVVGRHYRPSNGTELRYRAAQLDENQVEQAKNLARGADITATLGPQPSGDDTAAVAGRVRTLELAERLSMWRASKGDYTDDSLAVVRAPLLQARARLPAMPDIAPPQPAIPPEAGHRTGRVDLYGGSRDGQPLALLQLRPAYHDVIDPEGGYQRGAQIQFFSLAASLSERQKLRLEHFTPVDILSLAPRGGLGDGPSWKVSFGLTRAWGLPAVQAPLAVGVNGGPGRAWDIGAANQRLGAAYALMDNQLWYDRSRETTPWRIGSGLHLGLLLDPTDAWRLRIEANARYFLGRGDAEQGFSMHHRWRLDDASNLILRCEWQRRADLRPRNTCLAGWQRYW